MAGTERGAAVTRSGIAGLVLAAGGGRRLGGRPKALLSGGGRLLVERAVDVLREGGCASVHVVLGARAEQVREELRRRDARGTGADAARHAPGVRPVPGSGGEEPVFVENPEWESGMGSSVRAGLDALATTAAPAALVLLVDQPGIGAGAVARVAAALEGPRSLAAAAYEGRRGHPVLFGRERWADIARGADGDRGARDYLREHEGELRLVECADIALPYDIDTAGDLWRLDAL